MMRLRERIAGLRSRKVHGYCVGAAKTGTTSIAQAFTGALRAAHEPLEKETTELVMDYVSTRVSETQCMERLLERDKRLNLELESSHPLGYLVPIIVKLFPDARFIVTVREPHSWIRSRLNFHAHRDPPQWQAYRDFIWSRHHSHFEAEEESLQKRELFSLDAYLKQYSEQYEILFSAIPEQRRLVVRTDEINRRIHEMASFLNLRGGYLATSHANKMTYHDPDLLAIDPGFLNARVEQHCGWITERFFASSP